MKRLIEVFVALAMLLVSGVAAAAGTLQLTCEGRDDDRTYKVQVDLDNKIVTLLNPAGAVIASTTDRKMNALEPSVFISEVIIQWSLSSSEGLIFDGELNRESGNIRVFWYGPQYDLPNAPIAMKAYSGRCRLTPPVTQLF
jgi:hypothetical protein